MLMNIDKVKGNWISSLYNIKKIYRTHTNSKENKFIFNYCFRFRIIYVWYSMIWSFLDLYTFIFGFVALYNVRYPESKSTNRNLYNDVLTPSVDLITNRNGLFDF